MSVATFNNVTRQAKDRWDDCGSISMNARGYAVWHAATRGNIDKARLLLNRHTISWEHLSWAIGRSIGHGHFEIARLLLASPQVAAAAMAAAGVAGLAWYLDNR